ncbi:SpoIIE family protein phosphatase [Longivirga aurantiaca]|uniref:SpoIIE family protein phosphatase n=1 Tax=Longivirga aurantiaca TaxID=1837743 RepID=A0ABW1T2E2_9ACTN
MVALPIDNDTDALHALSVELAGAVDAAEVVEVITAHCAPLLRASMVTVSTVEDDGTTLRLVSSVNTPTPVVLAFDTHESGATLPAGDALRSGQPVVIRSVDELHERYPGLTEVDLEHNALCVLPLLRGEEPVGVLGLGWCDAAEMTAEVVELSQAVAEVCASALYRAVAAAHPGHDRTRSEAALASLRSLQAVAAELAHTVDLSQAAAVVLEHAVIALGAEAGALNVLDDDGTECTQIATVGLDGTEMAGLTSWQVRDSSLARELVRTGLPILITDSECLRRRFPDLVTQEPRQEAWATLLLTSGCRNLGIVSIGWREPREFSSEDVSLLQTLADHLAAALDRNRLMSSNDALLTESTRIAETLQRSLMPGPLPEWPGVTMAAGLQPAELGTEVCGDFYDAFPAVDGSLVVVIGDVAGRGVNAAGLTGMVRHTLRALARDMPPAEALYRLNRALVEGAWVDEPRLLTAAMLRLTRLDHGIRAEISLAGHCLPVVVRDRVAEHVGVPGMLLGAFADVRIGTVTVDLSPGDLLLLHTDGVTEARRHGVEFGESRLLKLLSAMTDPRPDDTVEHVLGSVDWYRTTAPDDMAVLVVRAT